LTTAATDKDRSLMMADGDGRIPLSLCSLLLCLDEKKGGKTTFNSQGLVGGVETVEEATMTAGMVPSHITAAVLAL
jgi:hypothetical protein